MNAQQAIDELNACKLVTPKLADLVHIVTYAAIINRDDEAINFLFLCNWRHKQLPN